MIKPLAVNVDHSARAQNQSSLKMRVWPSLDFTIGSSSPPPTVAKQRDTRTYTNREWWVNFKYQWPLKAAKGQPIVHQFFSETCVLRLTLCKWSELFQFYSDYGDIVAALERAKLLDLVTSDRKSLLGLSAAVISHNSSEGLNKLALLNAQRVGPARLRRGTKGITPYGKKMVRSAGAILEERFGRANLTLGTCTLPALEPDEYDVVAREWAELVRKFFQELQRLLWRKGLSTDYVQVTEIQEKRWHRWKQLGLHLHWVIQGRVSSRENWRIPPTEIRELWERLLGNVLNRDIDGKAATRIERPRKSLQAELGKYLSKGATVISEVSAAGKEDLLPRAWWGAAKPLKAEVKARIVIVSGSIADFVERNLKIFRESGLLSFTYIYRQVDINGGKLDICIGSAGRFRNKQAMQQILGYDVPEKLLTA